MSNALKYVIYRTDMSRSDLTAFAGGYEEPWEPGYVSGPIIRDCYIVEYCRFGKGTVMVNHTSFDIPQGQYFVIFPGSVVTLRTTFEEPWGFTWVCFQGTKIAYHLENMGITEENPIFPWRDRQDILDAMFETVGIVTRNDKFIEFDQNQCANKLFGLFARACDECRAEGQNARTQAKYVSQAIRYIEANYNHRITVGDIAAHIGLNRTYFATLFKAHMGQTPQEFLLRHRIQKACDFFSNPHSTVASVAYSLGYEPHIFSRLFKQFTGQTPTEYKNSLKEP